jgi:hypothetical protein
MDQNRRRDQACTSGDEGWIEKVICKPDCHVNFVQRQLRTASEMSLKSNCETISRSY